jgi:hypothetical protein
VCCRKDRGPRSSYPGPGPASFHVNETAAFDKDTSRRVTVRHPRRQFDLRDRRDRCESFAAKSESADRGKIFERAYLRRRVTLEREDRVLANHSAAVIRNTHQPSAAELDVDLDTRRSGIDRILDELFYNRSGPLDDFAGGNLVSEVVGEYPDLHYK